MPRSFDLSRLKETWRPLARDPKSAARTALGVLLAANLVAAWFVFQTPGGSLEELEREIVSARKAILMRQQAIGRLKQNVENSSAARQAGNNFMSDYFLDRRVGYSTLEIALAEAATSAGVKAKERTFSYELVEGSEDLGMLTINANFEGTYADLIQFVNQIDRSKRLVIIEALTAQPQQQAGALAINLKLNLFFREELQQ